MTQPADQPQPPQFDPGPVPPTINANASVVPGPNGDPMIQLALGYGFTVQVLTFDVQTAQNLGPALANVLANAVAQARQISSGLVIAPAGALNQLPKLNGHGPHRG